MHPATLLNVRVSCCSGRGICCVKVEDSKKCPVTCRTSKDVVKSWFPSRLQLLPEPRKYTNMRHLFRMHGIFVSGINFGSQIP